MSVGRIYLVVGKRTSNDANYLGFSKKGPGQALNALHRVYGLLAHSGTPPLPWNDPPIVKFWEIPSEGLYLESDGTPVSHAGPVIALTSYDPTTDPVVGLSQY